METLLNLQANWRQNEYGGFLPKAATPGSGSAPPKSPQRAAVLPTGRGRLFGMIVYEPRGN
jgi:hypothetical protein